MGKPFGKRKAGQPIPVWDDETDMENKEVSGLKKKRVRRRVKLGFLNR